MGNMLPKPVMSAFHERGGNSIFRYGSSCVNGYRDNMEDAHVSYFKDNWGFFGVFDGHCNDHCSAFLEKEWLDVLSKTAYPITDEEFKAMTLAVDHKYMSDNPLGGSTGTFFFVEKVGEEMKMQIGNVGDSRVLVADVDGKCHFLTFDHKPTVDTERDRIEKCHGYVDAGRVNGSLAISRAFGDADYKRGPGGQLEQQVIALPDITHAVVPAGVTPAYAVLACDGVFEGDFSNEQVIDFINHKMKTETDLAMVSYAVCDEAIKRGSKDNISCVIVQFRDGSASANDGVTFVPGPFAAPAHDGFRSAYAQMAERAGLSAAQCVEHRYDALIAMSKQVKQGTGSAGLEGELQMELSVFVGGPPESLSGEQRTAWFEQVARGATAGRNIM